MKCLLNMGFTSMCEQPGVAALCLCFSGGTLPGCVALGTLLYLSGPVIMHLLQLTVCAS